MQESNHDISRMAADLYISELMIGKKLGSRLIRKMIEGGAILSHRDLFDHSIEDVKCSDSFNCSDCDSERIAMLKSERPNKDKYYEIANRYINDGIVSVSEEDQQYPHAFRQLEGMPRILYCKGDSRLMQESGNTVSVVGSRTPSGPGLRATEEIAGELAHSGVVIVSGLARGIDTAAHNAALASNGKTIAVTACGLDLVYPPENKALFEEISRKGLLLSEMPPGQKALRQYFPARNRIMSALSDVVAIIEAGQFSGTLHTASFAAAQGRDVFVLPGSIYSPYCRGNLMLLQDGADLLTCAGDILARLSGVNFSKEYDEIRSCARKSVIRECLPDHPEKLTVKELSGLIFEELSNGELTLDELISSTQIPFDYAAPLVSEMLLSGSVSENRQRFALTFPYT
jgi:DNA processing protein